MFDDILGKYKPKPRIVEIEEVDKDEFEDIIGEVLDETFAEPTDTDAWLPKKSVYRKNRYSGKNKKSKKRRKS